MNNNNNNKRVEAAAEDPVGGGQEGDGRWKNRWKVRDLLADGRCSRAMLDFLSSTDVGTRVPVEAEDGAVSAVSELEVREWLEEQGAGAEVLGAGGEPPLCLPTPNFTVRAGEG